MRRIGKKEDKTRIISIILCISLYVKNHIALIISPPRRAPVLMILWLKQCHKYYGVTNANCYTISIDTVSIPCGSAALASCSSFIVKSVFHSA